MAIKTRKGPGRPPQPTGPKPTKNPPQARPHLGPREGVPLSGPTPQIATPGNADKNKQGSNRERSTPSSSPRGCLGAGRASLAPAARNRRGTKCSARSPARPRAYCRSPALASAGHRPTTRRTVSLQPLTLRAQGCQHARARRAYCRAWPEGGALQSTFPSSMPGSPRPAARNSGGSGGLYLGQRPRGSGRPPSLGPRSRLPPREPPSPSWPPAPPRHRCRHTVQASTQHKRAHGAQAARPPPLAASLPAGPEPLPPLRPTHLRSTTS